MRHLRIVCVVVMVLMGGSLALPAAQNFQIQNLMSEMNNAVQSIDREIAALKDLLSSPTRSRDYARRRAEIVDHLKQLSARLRRDAKRVGDLEAEGKDTNAARRRIIEGYSAEFYAGNRIEFERAVNGLKATPGPGDREAVEKVSTAAATLRRTADAMGRELQKPTPTPSEQRPSEQREPASARLKRLKLQPMRSALVVDSANAVALTPARKMELIKGLGVTVPPQGLQSEVVLSPRFPYKGQVAYMKFDGRLDTAANTFDMRTGNCDLYLQLPQNAGSVLVIVTGTMTGSGKFGFADYGPGELGQAPWYTDVMAYGEKQVPFIFEGSADGWYRIAMSVQLNNNAKFDLRQIDVSYLK